MDQYIDNRQKEIFWNLLANPADNGASYLQSLERLTKDYPQSGLLQAMLARVAGESQIARAATYVAPRILYKFVNNTAGLPLVDSSAIIDLVMPVAKNHVEPSVQDSGEQAQYVDTVVTDNDILSVEAPLPTVNETAGAVVTGQEDERLYAASEDKENVTDSVTEIEALPVEQPNEAEKTEIPAIEESPDLADAHIEQTNHEVMAHAEEPLTQEPVIPTAPEVEQPAGIHQEQQNVPEADNGYRFASRFPKRDVPPVQPAEQPATDQPIEDEVYDEIVSIDDIGFVATSQNDFKPEITTEHRFSEPDTVENDDDAEQPTALFHQPDAQPEADTETGKIQEEEEKLILGGIVGGDYLLFDKKLDELRAGNGYNAAERKEPEPAESAPKHADTQAQQIDATAQPTAESKADEGRVARYDDDKMPYTFLWWLNKTRKEHAENLRPYAPVNRMQAGNAKEAGLDNLKRADELQQQYFENIFSLTSVSGIEREDTPEPVEFDHTKKEDVIIERFIQTDPQIKPLSADKLDNENKAKKSSEDQNEVVTETLARIYADQMLYHKAIATYKKLILKFPEKSTYFAARIGELEKKTN
ncbi:hypothetical protein [Mucilaginibacter sp. 44-25]|uniref:hypothetical protein n=1 Tax=Mucilaginibacter sp. 44-25 TaxID=1895794 RepID=UPI00095CF6B1|nr:hypothetical protein [Mucilaginibacter sp. 44-25]OJW15753.1 MAG: hypothetical protein BGO48_04900 [Mucilaginibacter sp. 44-25]